MKIKHLTSIMKLKYALKYLNILKEGKAINATNGLHSEINKIRKRSSH